MDGVILTHPHGDHNALASDRVYHLASLVEAATDLHERTRPTERSRERGPLCTGALE